MDNQRYSYTFDAIISPFKKKMNDIKQAIKDTGSFIKSEWPKAFMNEEELGLSELEEELAAMQGFLKELGNEWWTLGTAIREGTATKETVKRYEEVRASMDRTRNTIQALEEEIKRLKEEEEEQGETEKKHWLKIPGWVKKAGLAFIGVRSAYSFFSKVIHTAMANNAQLSQKMNAIWQSLGNTVAPVLEKIIDLILKAYAYLSIFIKAVSGGKVDLLANTSKSAKSTAKSMKETQKYLAGFDELNNVDTSNENSGGGIGGGNFDAFKGLDINTEWAEKLQQFGEWARPNWPLVTAALLGTYAALELIKKSTKGIIALGIGLAIIGLIKTIQSVIAFLNDPTWENFGKVLEGISLIIVGVGIALTGMFGIATGGVTILIGVLVGLVSVIVKHFDDIKAAAKNAWEKIKEGAVNLWEKIKTTFSNIGTWFGDKWQTVKDKVAEKWKSIKEGAAETWQAIKDAFKGVGEWFGEKWENVKQGFKDVCNAVIGFIEGVVNKGIKGINKLIGGINKIQFDVPNWVPIIGGQKWGFNLKEVGEIALPRLDTGTNYVPNDQLAMIHKGEAVIPKKFNSSEYFNNAETNELLQTLIDKVDGLELRPYVTVKDVGEASAKYQNQQYRLRGRALVNG